MREAVTTKPNKPFEISIHGLYHKKRCLTYEATVAKAYLTLKSMSTL